LEVHFMPIDAIKPQKGSELIAGQIRRQVQSGEWPPGSRLPAVTELATQFAVGRSTVREALSALKATGWVDIRHGGGTFVAERPPQDGTADAVEPRRLIADADALRDVIEVRKFIEAGSAAYAAKRHTEADRLRLESILQDMEAAILDSSSGKGSPGMNKGNSETASALEENPANAKLAANDRRGEQADEAFHLAIAAASHNRLLEEMMQSITHKLQNSMQESRRLWFFAERATARTLLSEHRGIFDAIVKRDESLAAERMMTHIAKVDAVLKKYFSKI
jgi:GntR family transcriptional repressor for pyruvate dehydrogenase complex